MGRVCLVNWNLEWATRRSRRGRQLLARILEAQPDVAALTETSERFMADSGHTISANPDYGYPLTPGRRKVVLWSQHPWADVDDVGSAALPGGRYVAGTTKTALGNVRFHGVCIPWRDAHVRTGRRDRDPWEDHLRYLEGLAPIIRQPSPVSQVIIGDFNQRIPRRRVPEAVFERMLATFDGFEIVTAGLLFAGDREAIDHVAISTELRVAGAGCLSPLDGDRELSDHFGVVVELGGGGARSG